MHESWNPVGRLSGFKRSRNLALLSVLVGAWAAVGTMRAWGQTFQATATPSSVCVGGTITVTLQDDCRGDYYLDSESGTGYFNNTGNTYYTGPGLGYLECAGITNGVYTYTNTYTTVASDGGNYLQWTFYSSCYDPTSTASVPVVAVNTVTFSPTNTDNWVGNTISFTANTIPPGVTCPCTTTWTGLGIGGNTGTSVQTYYTNTGTQTATAWVGTSSNTAPLTIHQLVATCVDPLPVPQVGRTNLGLGELVNLTVNPPGPGSNFWLLLNSGHSSLRILPNRSAVLAAGESPSTVDGVVGVTCQMAGINSPQATYGPITILAPTSIVYTSYIENWDLYQVMATGTNMIGLQGLFQAQVAPLTVSFTNAQIRENPTQQIFTFPCGSDALEVSNGPYPPFQVDDTDEYSRPLLNAWVDKIGFFPTKPITDLISANTRVMTNFSATISVPLEYQDANGNWHNFYTHTSCINISATGVTTLSAGAPGAVISSPPTNSGPWTNYGQ